MCSSLKSDLHNLEGGRVDVTAHDTERNRKNSEVTEKTWKHILLYLV